MSEFRNVTTQAELEKAIEAGDVPVIVSDGEFYLTAGECVRVGDSSQPRVVAWGSSQPRVEARDSSQPRVVARGSSQPRVEARGSSQPRVVAWDSSQVSGTIGEFCLAGVEVHERATVDLPGAVVLKTPEDISSLDEWIDYYNLANESKEGITVFKLVDDELRSGYGTLYEIGADVRCDDWSSAPVCGGGLHFSPSPTAAHRYASGTRYLACEVRREDVVLLGDKIKAPSCKVLFEVDEDGERLEVAEATAA